MLAYNCVWHGAARRNSLIFVKRKDGRAFQANAIEPLPRRKPENHFHIAVKARSSPRANLRRGRRQAALRRPIIAAPWI